ncbi:sulfate adenylyltransferase subunit CysD [Corynebacterium durum]|uniref:sulfate adenylyltransferase subunit CysD n=1 Tax=Corynebacterium durum TaxID=61592 RepID=UPI003606803B
MTSTATTPLSPHLKDLENESIHILREVAGQFDRVALLFSGGKDSVVVFELARRAFAPAAVPFELLHVDTGHNFPEVIEFRDRLVEQTGARLRVAAVQDWIDRGDVVERPDGTRNPLQTIPLVDTINEVGYGAVLGGARRDEERARAKERVFSVRDSFGGWDPRRQRPELWNLYNGEHLPGENIRVFPISNWTEADVWEYIGARDIQLPPIYFAHEREVFQRDGMWLTAGEWGGPRDSETVQVKRVRYRTVGDMSCTGAVLSNAATVDEVITEIAASRLTERGATRADDRLSESAMEDRKKEGYF